MVKNISCVFVFFKLTSKKKKLLLCWNHLTPSLKKIKFYKLNHWSKNVFIYLESHFFSTYSGSFYVNLHKKMLKQRFFCSLRGTTRPRYVPLTVNAERQTPGHLYGPAPTSPRLVPVQPCSGRYGPVPQRSVSKNAF